MRWRVSRSDACCCGQPGSGNPPVPLKQLQTEWEIRKVRNLVHLTTGGCLGPCPLANVVLLFFDGRPVWLQSINGEAQIRAVYDYIDQMLAADCYLPPGFDLAC